jgi:PAS domain-containing protein
VQYFPLLNSTGVITGGVAAIREMNTKSNLEAGLLEGEEKFRNVAQTSRDAIILMDEIGEIIFWNNAADELLPRGC